jgi:PAS domain S-box-containing protein
MQVTLSGTIRFITSNCENQYGFKPDEVIGKKFTKFAPKKEWKKYFFRINQMLSGKKVLSFETAVFHKNGQIIDVDFSGQMVKSNGKSYFYAVMRNISEKKKLEGAKKKIDERYRLILENSNCPITYLDLEGNIILINKIGAKNLKSNQVNLIGQSIYEILPEFADEQKKRFNTILKTGKGITRVDLIDLHDSKKWFLSDLQPVKDENGKIIGIQIFSIDVSDQKEVEAKLRKSEEKWKSLVNNIPFDDRIVEIDKNGIILYTNRVSPGREVNKIIGKNYLEFVVSGNHHIVKKSLNSVFDLGISTKYESKSIDANGDIVIYDSIAAPVKVNKSVKSVIIIARNITNRIKSENALKESEEKYSTLFHNSNDSIFIHDLNGNLLDVNKQALILFGYKNKEILSINIKDLHPSYALEKSKSAFQEISEKGFINFEIDFKKKNGDIFSAEVSSSMYKSGNRTVIQGIIRDITQRKLTEMEIKKSKDYLQSVIDSTFEVIFTVDSNYSIRTWNKTAENIIGIKKKQIIGKYLKQIDIFENPGEIRDYIQNIIQGKKGILSEITLNTRYGTKKVFSISQSYIKDSSKNIIEILFVCRDITLERELYGKLKYGNNYVVSENVMNTSLEIFKDLIKSNKQGLYIGRKVDEKVKNEFRGKNIKIIKLSDEKTDEFPIVTTLEDLYQSIKDFVKKHNKSVVLIGRVDYLINNYSFEKLIKTLYRINDLILKHNSILILRVNPSIINEQQHSILNEEFDKIPSQKIKDIQISEELFEILEYIQKENMMNKIVSYSRIGSMFHISKITVKNRIESLLDIGLIYVKKQGKTKLVNITEKGKNILIR